MFQPFERLYKTLEGLSLSSIFGSSTDKAEPTTLFIEPENTGEIILTLQDLPTLPRKMDDLYINGQLFVIGQAANLTPEAMSTLRNRIPHAETREFIQRIAQQAQNPFGDGIISSLNVFRNDVSAHMVEYDTSWRPETSPRPWETSRNRKYFSAFGLEISADEYHAQARAPQSALEVTA